MKHPPDMAGTEDLHSRYTLTIGHGLSAYFRVQGLNTADGHPTSRKAISVS